ISGLDTSRYYGVFVVGDPQAQYDILYDYTGNTFIDGQARENDLVLIMRENNADTTWKRRAAIANALDPSANIFVVPFQSGTEYLAAFHDAYPLPPGPGNALELDGTDDYVDISEHAGDLTFSAPATIEFWARSDSNHTSNGDVIFAVSDGDSLVNDGRSFQVSYGDFSTGLTDELIAVTHVTGSSTTNWTQAGFSTTNDVSNEWHHYAVVADGSAYTFYMDGVQQTTVNSSLGSNPDLGVYGDSLSAEATAEFGRIFYNTSALRGDIDEFRLWDTILTADQIRTYLANKNIFDHPELEHLEAYYRFDDATGTLVADLANGSDGGLMNGSATGLSGAALGDTSVFNYSAPYLVSLTPPDGSTFLVNNVSGAPDGMHLYLVNEPPNNTDNASGVVSQDTSRYFGVFAAGGTNVTFNALHGYSNNALLNG
ncbi:MAG: LamG domain-containing protein, partial [Bacteroidota bacterium]